MFFLIIQLFGLRTVTKNHDGPQSKVTK